MKFKYTALSTMAIAVIGSMVWWQMESPSSTTPVLEQPLLRNAQLPSSHFKYPPAAAASSQDFEQPNAQAVPVTSLAGSHTDGAVNIDEHGNVLIDQDLHRLFDYHLAAVGELGPDEIRQRLLRTASDYLSLDQLEQLRDHFDDYVAYLRAAEHLALSFNAHDPASNQLEAVMTLRRAYLGGAMADAFFAEEEAYAVYAMSGEVSTVDVPEDLKLKWLQAEDQATAYHDVLLENQQFNAVALSEIERLQLRTATYGGDVAAKLAALDVQHQQWLQEVDEYLAMRHQLAGDEETLAAYEGTFEPRKLKRLQVHYRARIN